MNSSRKKPSYPLTPELRQYLRDYDREVPLPVSYADLRRFSNSFALLDRTGQNTLWQTVHYEPHQLRELSAGLVQVYAQLKTAGDLSFARDLLALNRYHRTAKFSSCDSMGDIVRRNLWLLLGPRAPAGVLP